MRFSFRFAGRFLMFSGLSLACLFAAAEPIVVERASPLSSGPTASSKVVAQLKQGTTGESLAQKGAWVNVQTAAGTGWVQSFNLRFVAPGTAKSAPSAPTARRGPLTPTIGIRGLEAEDLRKATYDGQQLGLLDGYAVSKQEAEKNARASGLSAERIEYLAK